MDKPSVGERMRLFRVWAKLSQLQAAVEAETNQATWSRLESGKMVNPSLPLSLEIEKLTAGWPDGPIRVGEWG